MTWANLTIMMIRMKISTHLHRIPFPDPSKLQNYISLSEDKQLMLCSAFPLCTISGWSDRIKRLMLLWHYSYKIRYWRNLHTLQPDIVYRGRRWRNEHINLFSSTDKNEPFLFLFSFNVINDCPAIKMRCSLIEYTHSTMVSITFPKLSNKIDCTARSTLFAMRNGTVFCEVNGFMLIDSCAMIYNIKQK